MTTQLTREEEAAEPFHEIQSISWQTLANTYVCRTSVREDNGRFSAVAIRRHDIVAEGASKDEAISRLQEAYKQAVLTANPALKPIEDVPKDELCQAIHCMIEVDDAELRKAIADRAPSCDDLELLAVEPPREWLDEQRW